MTHHPLMQGLFPSLLLVLATLPITASANPVLVREAAPLTPQQEHAKLKVAEGFEIQLFASEPMINKPINLAQDERGRIWVSSTVEYPYAAKQDRWIDPKGSRVRDSHDAIKILEDTDGDGKADKVTDFADGLNIPTGVLPWHKPEHKDGCIAWSIPNIWYFADTTGDGKADHREVLFGPLGWEKDTHGMLSSFRLGPDGWVYATHGFNNTSHLVARDGSTLELHSGNIFRFRPDGSTVEIWSRGQVNPFGLDFDRRGNLYSADCHSSPVYQLLRGAVYPSFGKPHDGIGFGPAMIQHTHGSTGICGISYLDRGIWGTAWDDHILIGNPVTSRVNHDRIEFKGSTPVAIEQPDFITSDDPWFRPVDLCLGGDGALYVADFYNRIIGHYEVPLDHPGRDRERGRIWRIVKKSGASKPTPAEIMEPFSNPIPHLSDASPFVRRAAAAQLQFAARLDALEPLFTLLEGTPLSDTHLRHVVKMAIREHLRLPGAFESLPLDPDFTEFVLAVSSPEAAHHLLRLVLREVSSTDRAPHAPPLGHLTHIAQHANRDVLPSFIKSLRALGAKPGINPLQEQSCLEAIVQGLEQRGDSLTQPDLLEWARELAPKILGGKGDDSWVAAPHPEAPTGPSPWTLQDRKCRDGQTVKVLSSLPHPGAENEGLTGILRSKPFPAPETLSFWICGHCGVPGKPAHENNRVRLVHAESKQELRSAFPPSNDTCVRVAWDLAGMEGESVQFEIIDGDRGPAYAWLAVTRIEPALISIASFPHTAARTKALRQLASLLKVTAPADLRDRLRPFLPASLPPPPMPISKERREHLDTLIAARSAAYATAQSDPKNGSVLFATHCALCHQVAGKGGLLGPQLDGVGERGIARLCEDILDPNRNVDAHFYLNSFKLKDGTTTAGFLRGESGEVLDIVDPSGRAHRLPKNAILSKETTGLSLMPAAFGSLLPEADFNDLLAWLLAQ